MKIVFHSEAGPDLARRLATIAGLDIAICREGDDALLMRLLPDCEILWHVLQPCTAAMIAAAPRLKLIQKIGVGVNTIDLEAAKARDIPVCNLPGTNARAVAELTLALMLAVIRRLARFDAAMRRGVWSAPDMRDGIGELAGSKVGLIGYGAVPRLLAPILAAMGCRILYTARAPVAEAIGTFRPLGAVLAEADIVSLHVPLTDQTARMIDAAALQSLRPGAILINTARGGLVDQAALVAALRSGRLGGAGLDVFTDEPPDFADALFALPNVVMTPHVAWLTTGTFERSFAIAAENCRRVQAREPLLHRVA